MNNRVIDCTHLAKSYQDGHESIHVLSDVTLHVMPSELVAIVGHSGCGKSTLLQILAGLDHPTSGQVCVHGQDIHALSEVNRCQLRNKHLGFIYQFHHLLPEFSALENVAMPLLIRGEAPNEIRDKSRELLTQVGLEARLSHRLSQLSGGERQRVAIARALIGEPSCILADEPTGNLDPYNSARVLELFVNLQKKRHTSVIMVTHDQSVASNADRVLRLDNGVLV
jgi:lipoprotein-releasing system ATP-binding protein